MHPEIHGNFSIHQSCTNSIRRLYLRSIFVKAIRTSSCLMNRQNTQCILYVCIRAPLVWEPQNSVSQKLSRLDVPSSYHFLSTLNSILEFRILVQFVTMLLRFCTLSVSSQLMLSVTDCRLSETHHSW